MAYSRDFDHYKLDAVVHQPYSVEHRFLDRRLPVDLRRSDQVQRWKRVEKLGKGGYGKVWLERLESGISTGHTVRAVKRVQKAVMKDTRELIALSDFSTRKHLNSRNFVEFYGWFDDPESVYIAMEYFPHGTLERFIRVDRLQENEARMITAQLLLGLIDIHKQGYAHRDLKPENIFIDTPGPRWSVKIGDFGISKDINRTGTEFRTARIGTAAYTAPEIVGLVMLDDDDDCDKYTNKVDLWSLGCVVFEIVTCSLAFPEYNDYKKCCWGRWFPTRPDDLSEPGWEFIKSLLVTDPRKRLNAAEALVHGWITSPGLSAGNRGTADLLITPTDTDASGISSLPILSLPDRSTGKRTAAKEPTLGGREIEGYPKPTASASSSKHNTPPSTGDRKLSRGSMSPTPNADIGSISHAREDVISRPVIPRSQNVAADNSPVPRGHEARHDTYPTRESDSKNDGPLISDRTRLAHAEETFKNAEKIRQDLIQLETKQNRMASKELKELNSEYANLARLASTHHSQHDYSRLEAVNQKLLELSRNPSRRHPFPPYYLDLGCLRMIAAVYEEQEKYDQASAVYEELYLRQDNHNRLQARDRLSSLYWKQKPNLKIIIISAKGLQSWKSSSFWTYTVDLEISQPIINSSTLKTGVHAAVPNPCWNKTVHAKVHQETTLTFILKGTQKNDSLSLGSVRLRVSDILDLKTRRTVDLTRKIGSERDIDFLLSFSTDFDPANTKITPSNIW